ncbi:hypothetical protein Tco_0886970 [Tanacetum coccineum]
MGRDTIQLQDAVSTITPEYLLEFTSEFGISEDLHPELPGVEDSIVDFPEGKVGVYTRFLDFANYRLPISQFLFDILGYYQIHLSQLSVIGAAKVSHFEINCRAHQIIPTLNLFRVFYIPSYNSGWMSFSKRPRKNTPQCYTKPLDSLKNWNNIFFWVDERVFPTVVEWRASAPKDGLPKVSTYRAEDVEMLNTRRTPIQRQPELLLCLVGLSRNYLLGDDEYPTFLNDDGREMDLFNLIRAPNPMKVKTGTRPHLAHEIPLLVQTAGRVISMDVPSGTSESAGTSSTLEKSPLDFDICYYFLCNSQVKDNKIDLLVQQYEQFVISEDESIDNAFARFNIIITSLKALDEGYSRKNYVRKFVKALHPKWRVKVMTI